MPDLIPSQRCQGRKRNGDPCGSAAMTDGTGFCFQHNPDIPQSVKLDASRLGGLAHRQQVLPDLEAIVAMNAKNPKAAKKLLWGMVKHVLSGGLSTSRANSAGFLLRILGEWEAARRKHADVDVSIQVAIVRFDTPNGEEETPPPRVIVTAHPKGIASEAGTPPQARELGDPDA